MRGRYDEIRTLGADVVAIGTGDIRYAADFVAGDAIPYPVLLDDDGRAARAAGVTTASLLGMFHPRTWAPTRATWARGFRIHRPGPRVTQLGATFVLGPGPTVRYAHADRDSTDHAPLDAVVSVLRT